MALYRYLITPLSAFGTPMRSDTLYGHLLWGAAQRYGERRVAEIIEGFAGGEPPFILSSALPAGCLPLPSLPGIPRGKFKQQFANQGALCEMLQKFKKFRKVNWLSISQWRRLKDNLSQEALFIEWLANQSNSGKKRADTKENMPEHSFYCEPHVTIDRQSGSVLDKGGLFFSKATWYRPGFALDLYVESSKIEEFECLFEGLAQSGFGSDRSTGKGHFRFKRDQCFDPVPFSGKGSHRLSLSVCATEKLKEFEGFWIPFVKHGRTWSGFGEKNPFKKPFLAFAEGSLFSRMPADGYVLRNIHTNQSLVQIGWPLTIPVTLEGHHEN